MEERIYSTATKSQLLKYNHCQIPFSLITTYNLTMLSSESILFHKDRFSTLLFLFWAPEWWVTAGTKRLRDGDAAAVKMWKTVEISTRKQEEKEHKQVEYYDTEVIFKPLYKDRGRLLAREASPEEISFRSLLLPQGPLITLVGGRGGQKGGGW